jgi:hypothetical protein
MESTPVKENYEKLQYVWQKWREASGKKIRDKFVDYVRISNEGALANSK